MRADARYDSLLYWYAQQRRIDWLLLKAQMIAESAANPDAVSPKGAIGLTQFMRGTWAEWWDGTPGVQGTPKWSRTNPEAAIRAQAAYMAKLIDHFGSESIALAAYNWGWGRVRKMLRETGGIMRRAELPDETRRYIGRIEETRLRLKEACHGRIEG